MIVEEKVTSLEGDDLSIKADTVCIHGDGPHALPMAVRIHRRLSQAGVVFRAINDFMNKVYTPWK
jgi:UPF0271 protein